MRNKTSKIETSIKWQINTGVYKKGEKLPSENQVAIQYGCSRLTARKALQNLKEQKLLISRKSKGYFVSFGAKKLEYKALSGTNETKAKFHLLDSKFSHFEKQTFIDLDKKVTTKFNSFTYSFAKTQVNKSGIPFTVLHSFLNTDILSDISAEELQESVSAFLIKSQVRITSRIQRTLICEPPVIIQLKLNLRKSEKVVAIYSIMYDGKTPIEMAIRYTTLEEFTETIRKEY